MVDCIMKFVVLCAFAVLGSDMVCALVAFFKRSFGKIDKKTVEWSQEQKRGKKQ